MRVPIGKENKLILHNFARRLIHVKPFRVFPVLLEIEGFVAWGFNLFNALGDAPIMTHVHSMPDNGCPFQLRHPTPTLKFA
jgi:hypothetical protein